jgi:NADH-quinone oxidoreductase subunit L
MNLSFVSISWVIPALPLLAAGIIALFKQRQRALASSLAIGSMAAAFVLSCLAFYSVVTRTQGPGLTFSNWNWFQLGDVWVQLGWVLDPLSSLMLLMVSFVGMLIFIYSTGYMREDKNYTRFFCFMSLFAAAMLGLVIANSLLLLFICWELMGLTSYLLIGFWYHKPSAAAAAKKAFITTRIGDLAFLLGMVWLYGQTGTLLFYDHGAGCLEHSQLSSLVARGTVLGMTVSTGISLLLFFGAIGKSGQIPLHTWLPDAMEGPTPVSALIHAATMVAAGVFLMARIYPLAAAQGDAALAAHGMPAPALIAMTWVGAITAFFAASIAIAQTDIKRILAYSTVSQLGYMMMGLGAGGVAVGVFHLLTHAFFKALLFLGAGSVIHGCHHEQDIRFMGGLSKSMRVTFATYAVGMLALSGFPLLFSGFWSKDEILHAAHTWSVSQWPFYIGLASAFLTAFYMTRQAVYVFFGASRLNSAHQHHVRESPRAMIAPLVILAACAVLLGFLGTPAWPWIQQFLAGSEAGGVHSPPGGGVLGLMALASAITLAGLFAGYWFYGRRPAVTPAAPDPLQVRRPDIFHLLHRKFFIDELYDASFVRLNCAWARFCALTDIFVFGLITQVVESVAIGLSWLARVIDEFVVNPGFDQGCREITRGGKLLSLLQNGQVQRYLGVLGVAVVLLGLLLLWAGS